MMILVSRIARFGCDCDSRFESRDLGFRDLAAIAIRIAAIRLRSGMQACDSAAIRDFGCDLATIWLELADVLDDLLRFELAIRIARFAIAIREPLR